MASVTIAAACFAVPVACTFFSVRQKREALQTYTSLAADEDVDGVEDGVDDTPLPARTARLFSAVGTICALVASSFACLDVRSLENFLLLAGWVRQAAQAFLGSCADAVFAGTGRFPGAEIRARKFFVAATLSAGTPAGRVLHRAAYRSRLHQLLFCRSLDGVSRGERS